MLINEVAWMGSTDSHANEWIELRNTTGQPVSLNGWSIVFQGGKLLIRLKGEISAGAFFLLERTDDSSVPAVKADLIYKGSLPNDGGELSLHDARGTIVDQTTSPWPGGNNTTKQTMERTALLEWQTSEKANGTPKEESSPGQAIAPPASNLPNELKSDNTNVTAGGEDLFSADPSLQNPWWLFGAALAVTLIAGTAFLFMKLRK